MYRLIPIPEIWGGSFPEAPRRFNDRVQSYAAVGFWGVFMLNRAVNLVGRRPCCQQVYWERNPGEAANFTAKSVVAYVMVKVVLKNCFLRQALNRIAGLSSFSGVLAAVMIFLG